MAVPKLFVFAKEPRAGRVKTRLCPPLTPAEAAACHRAFVADTLLEHTRSRACEVLLAVSPDQGCTWLEDLARRFEVPCVPQGPGDLGRRMERALRSACAQGGAGVVIGSDSPDLPADGVGRALDALRTHRAVIGPSRDGGYYLIGCRGEVPPVFRLECAWGGPDVLAETRERLRGWGRGHAELEERNDVDTFEDLEALLEAVSGDAGLAERLPNTASLLTRLRERGRVGWRTG